MSLAVRNSRFPHMCRALLRFPHLSFIPPVNYPPLRGTSFHRKEGVSTRAPSLGRGCRAQRGGVGFLFGRRSRLLFAFPFGEGRLRNDARVLVYRLLETISPLFFIPLVPYPSLRGTFPLRGRLCIGDSGTLANGILETISLSLSYRHCPIRLAPLATFPTRGRLCRGQRHSRKWRTCDDLPLSFIPLVPYPARFARHLPHAGKALCRGQRHSHKCRACILCKQKPLCEDWLCRAVSGSIIPQSRILRDFSAYPHHFLS